jgi:rhomboid protease GluP
MTEARLHLPTLALERVTIKVAGRQGEANHVDGEIDYRLYSTSELHQALQSIDRRRYPLNFAHIVEELAKRGLRADPRSRASELVGNETGPVQVFVWFKRKGIWRAPNNSFELVGRGELRLDMGTLQISGNKRGYVWSGERESLTIPLTNVVNVEHAGNSLRLEVQAVDQPVRHLTFTTEPGVAARLAARLPTTQTTHFRAARAEVADFNRRLAAMSPRAPVTHLLVLANLAVFVAIAFAGAGVFQADGTVHVQWGSNFAPLTVHGEWWRLFTSTFLHFGLVHLALNMWALYANGALIERLFGSAHFVALYVFAGLTGSLASAWWNPLVNSAGASGAIFGIFGGLLAFMLSKQNRVPLAVMTAHRNSVLAFVIFNVANGFAHPGIDNAAHLGGLGAGFVLGLALARPVDPDRRAAAGRRGLLTTAAVSAAALAFAAFALVRWGGTIALEPRFRADLVWIEQGESQAIDTFNQLVELAHADKLSDAHFVHRLEREVIPFWEEAADEFPRSRPHNAAALAVKQSILRLIENRRRAFKEMSWALHQGDTERARRASRELDRGKELIEELSQHAAKMNDEGATN